MASSSWQRDDLVTGEAVVLQLQPAGIGLRIASGLIDVVLRAVFLTVLSFTVVFSSEGLDEAVQAGLAIVLVVTTLVLWPTAVETLSGGRTLGKRILGLRTVRDDGGRIDLRRALTRHLVGFVEVWILLGWPALIAGAFSPRSTRLGDMAAGTFVARDRVSLALPEPVPMPPALQTWAAGADIGRIPPDLVAQMRYVLRHGDQFTPQTREGTRQSLASDLAAYVVPAPPDGTTAQAFLAGVLAEQHRRFAERLAANESRRVRLFGAKATGAPGASPPSAVAGTAPAEPGEAPSSPTPG